MTGVQGPCWGSNQRGRYHSQDCPGQNKVLAEEWQSVALAVYLVLGIVGLDNERNLTVASLAASSQPILR